VSGVGEDGRPDCLISEMDAGGWEFPYTPKPRLIAYLNQGGRKFQKVVLAEGAGHARRQVCPEMVPGPAPCSIRTKRPSHTSTG
jgi:hypothetical protein